MLFAGLIGRSESRKEQAICHLSIKSKKKRFCFEVIPVEQLCLLPEFLSKYTQKQFLETKNTPIF